MKMEKRVLKALENNKSGLSARELAKETGIRQSQKTELLKAVDSLIHERKIINHHGRFIFAGGLGLIGARIVKVTATFGFARPLTEDAQDIFIPGKFLKGSMPGDMVTIRVSRGSGELPEGEVTEITEAAAVRFSGVLTQSADGYTILPDQYVKYPVTVNSRKLSGAKAGDKVLAEIYRRGERHSEHVARILEVFGSSDSARACCAAVLAANSIPVEFSPEALEQASALASGNGIHPKELAVRMDLRDSEIFTIDGADTKDIDDAISLKRRTDGGWSLGVHIADVSYYVTAGSPLDSDAFLRGTSVYFADSVVPMLPPELSNGICSLNPGEDRLSFSALIELDRTGNIESFRFAKTVIRSRVKGVYGEINAIFDATAGEAVTAKYGGLISTLMNMKELSEILKGNRHLRGSVNLESSESKIVIGADGSAADVMPRTHGICEGVIEEFMLTANECAAKFALDKGLPFIFRIHEDPSPERIESLYAALESFGVSYKRSKSGVSSGMLAGILDGVKGLDIEPIVNSMMLRSMAKAKYSEHNAGHFGLALKNYAHFTSPIRRYPDLCAHRIMSGAVTGMRHENIVKRFGAFASVSAARSTDREIAAMTAERLCEDVYKAEYMRRFIGEEYDAIISSAAAFGLYVRLENTVEGLVRHQGMPAGREWRFDGMFSFYDEVSGERLRLGDKVRVRVAGANVGAGQVDFVFA